MNFSRSLKKIVGVSIVFSVLNVSFVFADNLGKINGTDVNVRMSGSSEAPIVSTLNQGDVVHIISEESGWFKIAINNDEQAYVSRQLVSLDQADAVVSDDGVNVRTSPSNTASIATVFNNGQKVAIKGMAGDWCIIDYEGQQLYIHKQFISSNLSAYVPSVPVANESVSKAYALINCAGGLNVRKEPSPDGAVINSLYNGTAVDVLEVTDGWVKAKLDDGTIGYLSSDFILLKEGQKPANQVSSKADQIIEYAKKYLGTPYAYGQAKLGVGVDCSGFTYAVFKDNGITLNRSSRDQVRNGTTVDKSQLLPGDLVFFDTEGANNGAISHVGLYIGEGKYIHSSNGKSWAVVISNLNDAYSIRTYVTAARVIQ